MNRLLSRALAAAAALALGSLAGYAVAWPLHAAGLGSALGAATGMLMFGLLDAWRAQRLLAWLRGAQAGSPPRAAGLWGEMAYRIERALRAREQATETERCRLTQFLSAIEASPNGVLMLDANDQIEWCNAVAAEHFGLDPVRDLRQRVSNLVRAPVFVAHLQRGSFTEAVQFSGAPGRGTLQVLVRPYGDGLKLVLSQDVTERERADAMRRDFVANVSHEIRSPLTVLAGFVETMASLPLSPAERERVLQLMGQQTERMQALVADLLTLAQLEGSPHPAHEHWLPVAALMQRAAADATALAARQHLLLLSGGDDAEIAGSASELHSAIGNLVNNAVRYTPEGGRIELRFAWRADGGADIDVSDTGIGIAREHLARLTERFYRVDNSRSRDTGGTGLGLSIVKHVVQRHGGEIEVSSVPGQGSRFRLSFPAVRVRQRVTPVAAA